MIRIRRVNIDATHKALWIIDCQRIKPRKGHTVCSDIRVLGNKETTCGGCHPQGTGIARCPLDGSNEASGSVTVSSRGEIRCSGRTDAHKVTTVRVCTRSCKLG